MHGLDRSRAKRATPKGLSRLAYLNCQNAFAMMHVRRLYFSRFGHSVLDCLSRHEVPSRHLYVGMVQGAHGTQISLKLSLFVSGRVGGDIKAGSPNPAWKRSGTSLLARRLIKSASYAAGGCRTIAAFRSFPTGDRA